MVYRGEQLERSSEGRDEVVLKLDCKNAAEKNRNLETAFDRVREIISKGQKLILPANQGQELKVLPVTIVEVKAKISSKEWFTLKIEAEGHTLKCWVRTDNLYLDAYQVNGGVIYQYRQSEDNEPLFKNSTILSYGGHYSDFGPSQSAKPQEYRKDIIVGFAELKEAVVSLCTMEDWESPQAKTKQCVVIMMTAEAIRMAPFFKVLMSGKSVRIGDSNILYYGVWKWSVISKALLAASSRNEDGNWIMNEDIFIFPKEAKKLGRMTASGAMKFISLVKNQRIHIGEVNFIQVSETF